VAAQKDPRGKGILPAIAKDQKELKTVEPALQKAPEDLRPLAKRITAASETYTKTLSTVLKLPPNSGEATALGARLEKTIVDLEKASDAFANESDAYAKSASSEIASAYSSGRNLILVALGFAAVLGLGIALLISSQINGVVRKIRARCARCARTTPPRCVRGSARSPAATSRSGRRPSNAHVQEMGDRVSHIAAATQQLTATSAQMGEEVASVAVVAEQTSATVEEVSASTQQTSASTQQIAASAQTLAATAVELRELVGTFSVAGG
jgi:methyl-accepting chemotaxis protein